MTHWLRAGHFAKSITHWTTDISQRTLGEPSANPGGRRPGEVLPRFAVAFHNRLHDGAFKIHVESRRGRLRHQYGDDLLLGIHPEVRPVRSAPPKTACRERRPALYGVVHHAHTQAIALSFSASG